LLWLRLSKYFESFVSPGLVAVIVTGPEDQQQRERRIARDYDLKKGQ
jgi:hypothetical protein